MEPPATRESKPGSAARDAGDGQAHNARRVTGPLAGAVLGPTVCGDCERGRWHRTTPTTGLFQRDGGWFGLGGGVFVTEEGLIAGVHVGRKPSIQTVNASGQEGEQGDASALCGAEVSASGKTTGAGDAGSAVGPGAGVFVFLETNRNGRVPGYWSMPGPEKVQYRASYALFFRPIGLKTAQETF